MVGALGAELVNAWIGNTPKPMTADGDLLRRFDTVFGLLDLAGATEEAATGDLDVERIEALIVERKESRQARDFARADAIRDELASMGVEIKDGAEGTTWSRRLD